MLRKTGLLAALFFLVVFFQNFDLLNARVMSPVDPSDIRIGAPEKPVEKASWAKPTDGSDLNTLGADWAGRQAHLLLNGADDRFLADANSALDHLFGKKDEAPNRTVASLKNDSENGSLFAPPSVHMARVGQIELGFQGATTLSCELRSGTSEFSLSRILKPGVDLKLQHETKEDVSRLQLNVSW